MAVKVCPKRNRLQILRYLMVTIAILVMLYPLVRRSDDPRAPLVGDKQIFFIDPTCAAPASMKDAEPIPVNMLRLTQRQACALEAAAMLNPDRPVYLVYTCPLKEDQQEHWSAHARAVLTLPNVHIWPVSFVDLMSGLPGDLSDMLISGGVEQSGTPVLDATRLIQFVMVWRYGGTYVDSTCFLNKPFENMRDFVVIESDQSISELMVDLSWSPAGRSMAEMIMYHLEGYVPSKLGIWAWNVFTTRIIATFCNLYYFETRSTTNCHGFHLLDRMKLFPMSKDEWKYYFSTGPSDSMMRKVNNSLGICVPQDCELPILLRTDQVISQLVQRVCPRVVSTIKQMSF